MKPIAGVVILYYPDKNEIVKNLSSYNSYLDRVFIIDNTPGTDLEKLFGAFENVTYIKNQNNLGIAAALNSAISLAIEKNYEWLLTMDQDSYFESNEISNYIKFFNSDFFDRKDVAIVCPQHEGSPITETKTNSFHPVISAITSGSMINVEICKKLGGFEEKLFIDEVDFEYCYRAILAGYYIFQYDHVFLKHRLGKIVNEGYFSVIKKSERVVHNPTRVYFMVRNHLYLNSKYSKDFPGEFQKRRKDLMVTLKNNLLFSGKFFKVLHAAWKGYRDFKQNRFDNKYSS